MAHIMFDLETWGTRPGSALRSIGAVVFDPAGGEMGAEFYRNISDESCTNLGLAKDPATMAWWARQSETAQASLAVNTLPLSSVVTDFHQWFKANGGEQIWCQGANFDSVLWEAAAIAAGARPPWKFWNVRDTRTIYEVFRFNDKTLPRAGTYHNALDDAKHQVLCVQKAIELGRVLS